MTGILKIKNNNTWVDIPAIIGPQGPQGPQGLQGPKGDTGEVTQIEFDDLDDKVTNLKIATEGNLAGLAVNAGQYIKADGTEGVNAALRCTNFIKIPDDALGFKMYGKTGETEFNPCVVIYDGSKTYFRRIEHSTSGVNVDTDGYLSFTFPTSSVVSNYKYIRFNMSNNANDTDKVLFEFSTINNAYIDTKLASVNTVFNNVIGYVGTYTGAFASAHETVNTGITLLANHSYKVYANSYRTGRWTVYGLGNESSYKYILPSDYERIFTNDATNRYLELYNLDGTLDEIDIDVYDLGSIDDLVQHVPQLYRVAKNKAGDYTSVTQCFLALKDDPRPKVVEIWEGDYDIYQEYVDAGVSIYTGDDPVRNYFDHCVWVPENTHVIGKGFVRLKWMPDPNTDPITVNQCKCVSPLNVAGNAVIENIELYCKNGRYCIHNDPYGKPQFVGAVQKYINVKCYKEANDVDSGGNAYGFAPTIGFGIDRAMHYSYENCSFFNAGNGRAFYGHSRSPVGGTTITEAMSSQITVVGCIMDSGSYAKCVKLGNAANSNVHIRVLFSDCYFSGDIDIENENGTTIAPNEFDVTIAACNDVTVTVADTNNRYPVKKYNIIKDDAVQSVAGKTGNVTLNANDVGYSYSTQYSNGTIGKSLNDTYDAVFSLGQSLSSLSADIIPYELEGGSVGDSIKEVVDDISEDVTGLKSHIGGIGNIIGDTTVYNAALAESNTGVGANWNFYHDVSLHKGDKIILGLLSYSGALFTDVLFRFYNGNTLLSLTPIITSIGDIVEYTLYQDCTRLWVQINRSAAENGVKTQYILSYNTKGISEKIATIDKELPVNTQELLRNVILANPNLRFTSQGNVEEAGNNAWAVSDYIPVGYGLTVTGYSYSSTRPAIVEYNASKTAISVVATSDSSEYITRTYESPSDVAYVRIQTITSIGNNTNAIAIIHSAPKIFYVEKDGSGDFTKLSDAINEAVRYMDSTVYVGPGTWDLIDELGEDYLNSVSSTQRGIYLKNRVHIVCSSNSKIMCNYVGDRADTIAWLSAFNAGPHGFTLENATIESSNCRYSVHDERGTDIDAYNNYYINCQMTHDNSVGGYNQCIGGGLGLNGHVIIDGCTFKNPARTNYQIVYYHNTAGSGKSFVEVKGSYFDGTNTLGFQWYGTSPTTQKSTLFAHGNSLGSAIQHTAASGATIQNTEIIEWNNEIRVS